MDNHLLYPKVKQKRDNDLIDLKSLEKLFKCHGINYFSSSVFNKSKHVIAFSNNFDWFRVFNEKYKEETPGKDYILSIKRPFIIWDALYIDRKTMDFIDERNQVVDSIANISYVKREYDLVTAFTFGTSQGETVLMNFMKAHTDIIQKLSRAFLDLSY